MRFVGKGRAYQPLVASEAPAIWGTSLSTRPKLETDTNTNSSAVPSPAVSIIPSAMEFSASEPLWVLMCEII